MLCPFVHMPTSKGQLFQESNLKGFSVNWSFCCLKELIRVKSTKWALFRKTQMEQTGIFQVRGNRCRNKLIWKTLWLLTMTTQLITCVSKIQPHATKTPAWEQRWTIPYLVLAKFISSPHIFLLGTSNQDQLEGIIWWRKTEPCENIFKGQSTPGATLSQLVTPKGVSLCPAVLFCACSLIS